MRWQVATVAKTVPETINATTLHLAIEDWPGHRAGQHVDVRLTAEDGYSAQRSYSIASAPLAEQLELTVVRIDDGEVSPYLTTNLDVGDQFELRGPIGGYFVWETFDVQPVLLVGGGSGVVPLMAMLRWHAVLDHPTEMHLVYSARRDSDILYYDELQKLVSDRRSVTFTLTRSDSQTWAGRRYCVDQRLLDEVGWPAQAAPQCFVCGPTPFVEAVADALTSAGHDTSNIKTERFGPTGG